MTPPVDVVLVIGRDVHAALPESVEQTLRQEGLAVHRVDEEAGATTLEAWLEDDTLPTAVLLTENLARPLSIARRVHAIAPLVQIVFMVGRQGEESLMDQLSRAPRIGTHWSIVDPRYASTPRVLKDAVRATRQRSNLRTTLDRMNLKLQAQPPTTAASASRSVVVSDRYLASVLEHAGDAILALDPDERIATWNRGAVRLFGLEDVDALERTVDLLVAEDCKDELMELVHVAREGRAVTAHELVCTRFDGERFDAAVTIAPLTDHQGRAESVVVIVRDITERKRVETERTEANARLKRALEALEVKKKELLELNAQLEVQATTDALTGLKNRIVFHNSLTEMIAVAERSGSPLSLLLVDIDHFKRVNDEFGHLEGDRVLRSIADLLKRHTRDQDVVARFGGEEFAVLLPNTDLEDAKVVAEKLRVGCRASVAHAEPITISVGVAAFVSGDNDVTLIDRADRGLYAAKEAGRDTVSIIEASGNRA